MASMLTRGMLAVQEAHIYTAMIRDEIESRHILDWLPNLAIHTYTEHFHAQPGLARDYVVVYGIILIRNGGESEI